MKEARTNKIFWGVFLILAAVFLVVSQMGLVEGVGVVSVLFAIFWAAQLIAGIVKLSFGRILFSLAFLAIIFDEQLGIEAITPWTVLGAALLGTIGLNMIFRKKKKKYYHYETNWSGSQDSGCHGKKETYVDGEILEESREDGNGAHGEGQNRESGSSRGSGQEGAYENVYFETSFASAVKYVDTDNFKSACLNCKFGAMKVYFDNAVIRDNSAQIELHVSFSGVELYVPAHWKIVNQLDSGFSGVEEQNQRRPGDGPEVLLTGNVSFSGLEIIYI